LLDSREQVLSTADSDDINPLEYSSFTVMNKITLLGVLIHFLFLVSFYVFGVKELVWFNVGSCILYGVSYFLNRNGYYNEVLFLVSSEIVLHSCLAVYYIGWSTGFHYYTIAVAPIIFLSAVESKAVKLFSTAIVAIIYSGLAFYAEIADPVYLLSEPIIKIFKYSNIVALFFTISHPSYYYNSAVIKTRRKLNNLNQQLKILAATDSLTKLLNRWGMNKRMEREVKRVQNKKTYFVLILADIDDFKWVNDHYGHDCGDFILQELAQLMKEELSGQGLVSRWGGAKSFCFF
jgi:predicted signal transduction protein with EAL and GGDEF domain